MGLGRGSNVEVILLGVGMYIGKEVVCVHTQDTERQ
jgi:hypothetical protein